MKTNKDKRGGVYGAYLLPALTNQTTPQTTPQTNSKHIKNPQPFQTDPNPPGKGKRGGVYGAYLLAVYDPASESFQTICKLGTGFSEGQLAELAEALRPHALEGPRPYYQVCVLTGRFGGVARGMRGLMGRSWAWRPCYCQVWSGLLTAGVVAFDKGGLRWGGLWGGLRRGGSLR